MAAKQEVTAEEELTVKTQARAPSAGMVLQNPPCKTSVPLGTKFSFCVLDHFWHGVTSTI